VDAVEAWVVFGETLAVLLDDLLIVAVFAGVFVFAAVFCVICALAAPANSRKATTGTMILFIFIFFVVKK
jgi:hypothetical protein